MYFQGYSPDCLSRERTCRYAHPDGGYIHAMHQALWGDMHYRITGKTEDGGLEYIGGWQNNRPSPMHREIRFIENMFEELDSLGERFYDFECANGWDIDLDDGSSNYLITGNLCLKGGSRTGRASAGVWLIM